MNNKYVELKQEIPFCNANSQAVRVRVYACIEDPKCKFCSSVASFIAMAILLLTLSYPGGGQNTPPPVFPPPSQNGSRYQAETF